MTFATVLRPVMALKSGKTRGSFLDRVLFEGEEEKPAEPGMARLSPYDIEQIDVSLLKAGLTDVVQLHGEERSPLLFVAVAYATLASPRGRREVLTQLAEAQQRLNARVILELTHLDPGLPPSRLVELLGLVRPTCKTVFARIRPERQAIIAVTDCALGGVSLESSDLKTPEDEDYLTRVRLVMRSVGPRMMLHNLRTTAAINVAHAAGITYASLDLTHTGAAEEATAGAAA